MNIYLEFLNPPLIFHLHLNPFSLHLGSWTYDGYAVDIKHKDLPEGKNALDEVENGIDLMDYYLSTEWDLLAVPAKKYEKYYPCCSEPYPDIKFNITIRRKTLFYTVNLILPCVAICSVTLLVFYIPANSGEKITMGITILNSLNIFLLLVAEINPPTSHSNAVDRQIFTLYHGAGHVFNYSDGVRVEYTFPLPFHARHVSMDTRTISKRVATVTTHATSPALGTGQESQGRSQNL